MSTFLVETTKEPVWGWRETPKLYKALKHLCVQYRFKKMKKENCVQLKRSKVICFMLDARSYIRR